MAPKISTIITDLGGVFVHTGTAKIELSTPTSSISMRRLMLTSTWMQYERGLLTEQECYQLLEDKYSVQAKDIAASIHQARQTLEYDHNMAALFMKLKAITRGRVKIVMASNITQADYLGLFERWGHQFWSIFDEVFTSAGIGHRKPSLAFYRHVLHATEAVPSETIFLDDLNENVFAAMSLAIHGVVFHDVDSTARILTNAVGDPVQRGKEFLRRNARQLFSMIDGEPLEENFSQLLILEAMGEESLVNLERPPRRWNFFYGKPQYTSSNYPDDLDTNALALSILPYDQKTIHTLLDEMLEHIDEEGIPLTYYDQTRPRTDAIVALNVLVLFALHGRTYQLSQTLSWMQDILLTRAYLVETRYYTIPEWFLFHIDRLIKADVSLREKLERPLKTRVKERIGVEGDALTLAMRVRLCSNLDIENERDRNKLCQMQELDGGWEGSVMYRIPGKKKELGNRGVSTAFAVRALQQSTT